MKKVLLTGATGFLGKGILGIIPEPVVSLGRKASSDIICNLANEIPKLEEKYDLVIHAAGKAHSIPKTEEEKEDFFNVNLNGTHNLLSALEQSILPLSFVFISSVAVYGYKSGIEIDEESALNAADPYGKSKILAEGLVQDWCTRHGVICTILRLPLLIGKNPPGNLQAMISGINRGYYFNIAGGQAKKSMVLIEDVARVIMVAEKKGGIYNLTDGYHPSFYELSLQISKQLGKPKPKNIPLWIAYLIAKMGDIIGANALFNTYKLKKIKSDLTFSDAKARKELNWKPKLTLKEFNIK